MADKSEKKKKPQINQQKNTNEEERKLTPAKDTAPKQVNVDPAIRLKQIVNPCP